MFPVTETMYESSTYSRIVYCVLGMYAEYNVLGGIANGSPFRPDTGRKGLFL